MADIRSNNNHLRYECCKLMQHRFPNGSHFFGARNLIPHSCSVLNIYNVSKPGLTQFQNHLPTFLLPYGVMVQVVTSNGENDCEVTMHLMIESPAKGSQEANREFTLAGTRLVGDASQVVPLNRLYSKAPLRYQKATC